MNDNTVQEEPEGRSMRYIVRLTALTWLAVAAISWRAYFKSARHFELSPVIAPLAALPDAADWLVYGLQIGVLLWLLVKPQNRVAAYAAVGVGVFCILRDLLFLQPYTLMYMFTLLAAASRKGETERINALRIMVAGVYFWAGFHKQNVSFYTAIFPWFVSPLYSISNASNPTAMDMLVALAAFITPVFEAMIGIFLLFPKYRKAATLMALTMLTVVLVCLGPLGHNWGMVVWPWNVFLFLLELELFFRDRGNGPRQLFARTNMSGLRAASLALFVVAPVFSIYSVLYAYVGFKLYSGNIAQAEIVLPEEETLQKAPAYLRNMITPKHAVRLIEWSVTEVAHAPFPVPYVFKTGGAGLCRFLEHPKEAKLRIYMPPPFYTMKREQEDVPLCP